MFNKKLKEELEIAERYNQIYEMRIREYEVKIKKLQTYFNNYLENVKLGILIFNNGEQCVVRSGKKIEDIHSATLSVGFNQVAELDTTMRF